MRILYLDLDALTPSHLSCYGYERRTSPTIDAIAAEGVRCTNVYCSDAPCMPSRTAFYQGRFGIQTGVVGHGGTAADPKRQGRSRGFRSTYEEDSLPRQLQKAGFHTAMISPFGQRHAAHQFYAGFHEVHNTGQGGMEPVEVVEPVLHKWLHDNAARDRWYLHVNFWDIHTPYRAPLDYGNPFEDEPLPAWMLDAWRRHRQKTGPHSALDPGMYTDAIDPRFPRVPDRLDTEAKLKQWIDGYDTAIRYVDDAIARLVTLLRKAGVYDGTAIIISADHGENQGELGIYGEHATADQGTCNIPFIVKWPGARGGQVDQGLRYHLDWAPTCLELLGRAGEAPEIWDGRGFAGAITGAGDAGRDELVLSQCAHVCQRGVRFDDWLYMRTYFDGFHLFPKHMLFDLRADAHEQHDVAEAHPDVVREAAFRLQEWHDAQMTKVARTCSDVVDPLWTVMSEGGPEHAQLFGRWPHLPAYLRRLEATGRAEGAEALRVRYAAFAAPADANGNGRKPS